MHALFNRSVPVRYLISIRLTVYMCCYRVVCACRQQGHAALLFKRMANEEDSPIKLYTTRRFNRPWQRKMKPVRDSAGQIVPGEYA